MSPMQKAVPPAARTAGRMRLSCPFIRLPAMTAPSEIMAPTERSIPSRPPSTTRFCPAETIPRMAETVSSFMIWPPLAKPGATACPMPSSTRMVRSPGQRIEQNRRRRPSLHPRPHRRGHQLPLAKAAQDDHPLHHGLIFEGQMGEEDHARRSCRAPGRRGLSRARRPSRQTVRSAQHDGRDRGKREALPQQRVPAAVSPVRHKAAMLRTGLTGKSRRDGSRDAKPGRNAPARLPPTAARCSRTAGVAGTRHGRWR